MQIGVKEFLVFAVVLLATFVRGADFYADFITASHEQRVAWMRDGAVRTNMAFTVGVPPKTDVKGLPPRWCKAEGVNNFRDLGGWTGLGGKKVRYGRLFRSTHLGHVKDPDDFIARFGVKTDLDLRNEKETESLGGKSPLGEKVRFVLMPSPTYEKFGKEKGRKFFGKLFRVFLEEDNYPIVFHCAKGADRTGCVAFLLNGLLGVRESDLVLDWELTAFFNPNPKFRDAERIDRLVEVIRNEQGSTWTEKIVSYAKSCGITDGEIAKFRSLMLDAGMRGGR